MSDLKQCRHCQQRKIARFCGLSKAGVTQLCNEEGRRWNGRLCPDCWAEYVLLRQRMLRGTSEVPKVFCKVCTTEFPKKSNKIYCSEKCKIINLKTRKKKSQKFLNCSTCNKEIVRKNNRTKYCSTKCYQKSPNGRKYNREWQREKYGYSPRKIPPIKICQGCNKTFTKKNNKKYCSRGCLPKGKPYVGAPISEKKCFRCGVDFKTNISRKKYCTSTCGKRESRKRSYKRRKAYEKIREYRKHQRMLNCIDIEEIINFYKNRPKGYHVDHIIPLSHPDVCGLHVPWNMQYLTAHDNVSKSNSFDGTYENESWKINKVLTPPSKSP